MPGSHAPLSDRDFQLLFESAPGLYLVLLPDLTIAGASDAYLAATLTTRASVVGRPLFEVFPDNPDEPGATGTANLRASLERVLRTRAPDSMAVQKYDVRNNDGGGSFEVRHWSPRNTPVLRDGEVVFILHEVTDVTDYVRLHAHDAQQKAESTAMRGEVARMEGEVLRRSQALQESNNALRALQQDLELRVQERTAELTRTLEALRDRETQLRQVHKLEALGRLAGGVAHDFNNLLSVILIYGGLLQQGERLGPEERADVQEMHRAAERAAELTHQLLAFSRQQVLTLAPLDLNATLKELSRMLARVLGEHIVLSMALEPSLNLVQADRGQLEQVLMNLVLNARDAMPDGGRVTLETANVILDEEYARTHAEVQPGPHVMLVVTDTGTGMDRETQARIFDPFFTTKPMGKGTGLGLATVFGIVKQCGGHIWVYSEPGQGTAFRVYLPCNSDAAQGPTPAGPAQDEGPGHGTLLLVEDQQSVRTAAIAVLERAGYRVLAAASGEEALTLADREPDVDLLLTDVLMPGLSGHELCTRLRQQRPTLRAVFMSGYTGNVLMERGGLPTGATFVPKPLTPSRLLAAVRQALRASTTG